MLLNAYIVMRGMKKMKIAKEPATPCQVLVIPVAKAANI